MYDDKVPAYSLYRIPKKENESITHKFMYSPKDYETMKIFFFKREQIRFFSNLDRDFYSENNSVSQVYIYITKIQKKS
jgi:hypothetical protein